MAGPGEPHFPSWLLLLHEPSEEDRPPVAIAGVQVIRPGEGTPSVLSTGTGGYVQGGESIARYTSMPSHLTKTSNSAAPHSAFIDAAHSSGSDFGVSGIFFSRFSFTAGGGIPGSCIWGPGLPRDPGDFS